MQDCVAFTTNYNIPDKTNRLCYKSDLGSLTYAPGAGFDSPDPDRVFIHKDNDTLLSDLRKELEDYGYISD